LASVPGGGLGAGGIDQAAARFAAAGLEPGHLIAGIVGVVQFAGGLLIGLGLLSRWAALAAIALQAILIWKLQAQWGFYLNWTGMRRAATAWSFRFSSSGRWPASFWPDPVSGR
jgi:putative oxidoreductase